MEIDRELWEGGRRSRSIELWLNQRWQKLFQRKGAEGKGAPIHGKGGRRWASKSEKEGIAG